jgi:hypothetical protein
VVTARLAAEQQVRLEAAADGRTEARVRTPSHAWVRLQSLNDPEREARDIVERALDGGALPPVAVVIGVGTAVLVNELADREPGTRIIAFELFPGIPDRLTPQAREAAPQGGLTLVTTGPAFSLPVITWPASVLAPDPLIVVQPIAAHYWPDLVARASAAATQYIFERRANEEARERLAPVYLENTLQNLPELLCARDVSALDGIAHGDPLVICGAGPSLDRLLPELHACRSRAWFVAIDTAVRPLVAAGIVPDLVVSIDPTSLNGRHLLDLPTRARPWLVAESSLDPRAIRAFADRVIVCRLGAADPWPWLESIGLSAGRVRAWGSVLTTTCDIVRSMRPARVAFAGIDLAYTGEQPYCRGTAFEADWEAQRVRDGFDAVEEVWRARIADQVVSEPDLDGDPVWTAPHLLAFRNWVRTFVAENPSCAFVNVTGSGILHGPGIARCTLEQWVERPFTGTAPADRLEGLPARSMRDADRIAQELTDAIDGEQPWQSWSSRVPRIARTRINRHLTHAAREIAARAGETAVSGSSPWIDVPFDATHFFAQEPLEWRVTESNVGTCAYKVDGKTMMLSFKINHSTLSGGPARELFMRLPGHYVAARGAANAVWFGTRPIKETGYVTVHPGHDAVVFHRGNEEPFPLERDDFFVFGQLVIEVQ